MQALGNLEIGVLFWAGDDPAATVRERSRWACAAVRCWFRDMALEGAAAR
jgi:hypothetical protein